MSQHPFFPLELPGQQGRLLLTPCPGTQETTLKSALHDLKLAGATAVVTLMTAAEFKEHNVENIGKECEQSGLAWFHLPVNDEGAPCSEFERSWARVRTQIHAYLTNGEAVVVHCKGGSGRTGVVAAQIMLEHGVELQATIKAIKTLRPKAFSHRVQVEYITRIANETKPRN